MVRSPKLPLPAQLIIWGATRLTLTEKVVWYHTWFLDQGREDGCYIGAKSMGARLAISARTVEDARSRLGRLHLLESWRRPEGREFGYRATLPPGLFVPRTFREATPDLSEALDQRIADADGGLRGGTGEEYGRLRRPTTGPDVPAAEGASREGGRGEGASFASQPERQLPPASEDAAMLRKQEERAFARANELRGGMVSLRDLLPRDQVA